LSSIFCSFARSALAWVHFLSVIGKHAAFTPVPFRAFLAIYSPSFLWQSIASEDAMRMKFPETRNRNVAASAALAALALACALIPFAPRSTLAQANSLGEATSAAVCPIVYPDDQTPASRGYHYTFFGDAFFINGEGYLLTDAHVLETFRDGGQAFILVSRPDAPARLLKVAIIAKDAQHDIAILRASPNPFSGKYHVTYLPLSSEPAVRGQAVLAVSLHPRRVQDAQSFEAQSEDSSPGTVLSYESTQLEKSTPAVEVFLLSHPVVKGQSGSPVLGVESHAVVGLVEGLWLRGTSLPLAKSAALPSNTPGAAIPIRYAIALLQKQGILWRAGASSSTAP
jgi:S1-C subfamily serine protease